METRIITKKRAGIINLLIAMFDFKGDGIVSTEYENVYVNIKGVR